jgi:hypothetical protein
MEEKHSIIAKDIPLACTLTQTQQRTRGEEIHELLASSQQVRELSNGYEFQYPCEKLSLDKLAHFILEERTCCPFFTFELIFEPAQGPLWLRIYGQEGVKEMLREQFLA